MAQGQQKGPTCVKQEQPVQTASFGPAQTSEMGIVTQTISISDISLRFYQAKMGSISHSNN